MSNRQQEQVILIDKNDTELGTMDKQEVHEKGILHRAISVFITNSRGEWLLQRRAFNKYHSAGLWTNACCTHPQPGEKNMEAAHRRLKEEMGLTTPLRKILSFTYKEQFSNGLTEHELDHVFLGMTDAIPVINQNEVSEWKYVSYHELLMLIHESPQNFTAWFRLIFKQVRKLTIIVGD